METVRNRLNDFGKRGWTLKPYSVWGPEKPCPPRLVVNTYRGCIFQHRYCYISPPAKRQEGFRKHLKERIQKAKKLGLEKLVVMVSSSTDPFQPIERTHRDSQFAIQELLTAGFPVLVMTRNPQMLLEPEYEDITQNQRLSVDVSIPSLQENDETSLYYGPISAPLEQTYDAIRKLSDIGKRVRIKIEPIVPTFGKIQGQTTNELKEIVKLSAEHGAKMIIAKTMRLNTSVPKNMYDQLISLYREGIDEGHTLALHLEDKKRLMNPVLEACEEYGIQFCPCVDSDSISGIGCEVTQEKTRT